MSNDLFSAHTRSATFSLSLSPPMIDRLLRHREIDRLRKKYPWYAPHTVNFGKVPSGVDATDLHLQVQAAWDWLGCDSTDRALIRRGLLELNIEEHAPGSNMADAPACKYDLIRLSLAGALVAELLVEADFRVDPAHVPSLPPHPDARPRIEVGQTGPVRIGEPRIPDERDPEDAAYFTLPVGSGQFDRFAKGR